MSSTMPSGALAVASAIASSAVAATVGSKLSSRASAATISENRESSSMIKMALGRLAELGRSAGGLDTGSGAGNDAAASRGASARVGVLVEAKARGSAKVNVLPWPTTLVTWISPPRRRARSREMDKPRPVPPYLRFVVPSACRNASKIAPNCVLAMPMPVSRTTNRHSLPSLPMSSETPPCEVNLSAFESRFLTIWDRRSLSLRKLGGRSSTLIEKSSPRSLAIGSKVRRKSSANAPSDSSSTLSSSLPASTLAKSRMSSIMASRSFPAE